MSEIQANKLSPASGTALQVGDSGDTITIPSGATITNSGTATGFGSSNTPAFAVRKTDSDQSYSQNTFTKVTFNTELLDTNSAFASDKFTVPSGEAGTYLFNVSIRMGAISGDSEYKINLYLNGSSYTTLVNYITDESENPIFAGVQSMDLSVGDYVEVFCKTNGGGGNYLNNECQFTGFKLGV